MDGKDEEEYITNRHNPDMSEEKWDNRWEKAKQVQIPPLSQKNHFLSNLNPWGLSDQFIVNFFFAKSYWAKRGEKREAKLLVKISLILIFWRDDSLRLLA